MNDPYVKDNQPFHRCKDVNGKRNYKENQFKCNLCNFGFCKLCAMQRPDKPKENCYCPKCNVRMHEIKGKHFIGSVCAQKKQSAKKLEKVDVSPRIDPQEDRNKVKGLGE